MKKLLWVIALVFAVSIVQGQKRAEIEYICSEGDYDYFQFRTKADENNVFVYGYWYQSHAWIGNTQAGRWYTVAFRGLDEYRVDYAFMYIGEIYAAETPVLDAYSPCENEAQPQIPMNECLGIAPSAVNLPESGFFMVDGYEYAYNGNLSFLVALDSYWQWDLWHEGNYVLSFAQDEDMPCQIIESETP